MRADVVLTAYPAPDWTLKAILRGPSAIDLTADPNGRAHRFSASAAATAEWEPGRYALSLRAERDGEVLEVDTGTIEIRPDIEAAAAGEVDARSHVQRVLDAIEAVIEKRATIDQERYTINNRELWRTPIEDLLKLRNFYKSELRRINAQKSGRLFDQTVRIRFR